MFSNTTTMLCKKGGFITLWHDVITDITAKILSGLFKDARAEPSLLKLIGEEETMRRTTKKINEVRLDVNARGFWMND